MLHAQSLQVLRTEIPGMLEGLDGPTLTPFVGTLPKAPEKGAFLLGENIPPVAPNDHGDFTDDQLAYFGLVGQALSHSHDHDHDDRIDVFNASLEGALERRIALEGFKNIAGGSSTPQLSGDVTGGHHLIARFPADTPDLEELSAAGKQAILDKIGVVDRDDAVNERRILNMAAVLLDSEGFGHRTHFTDTSMRYYDFLSNLRKFGIDHRPFSRGIGVDVLTLSEVDIDQIINGIGPAASQASDKEELAQVIPLSSMQRETFGHAQLVPTAGM